MNSFPSDRGFGHFVPGATLGCMGVGWNPFAVLGTTPRINSLLIKPASAVCNLDCSYCFYLDREADPYKSLPARRMTDGNAGAPGRYVPVLLVPEQRLRLSGRGADSRRPGVFREAGRISEAIRPRRPVRLERPADQRHPHRRPLVPDLPRVQLADRHLHRRPRTVHDLYRFNKQGKGTWKQVMRGIEVMQKNKVEFNVLCVLSQSNVDKPKEVYKFFRSLGIEYLQFIPLSEFDSAGNPLPFTITPEQYGRFMVEMFDLWWPERRKVRIRYFDNIAEGWPARSPGNCTMHETCDSYVVVEYNGDIYPCDFFVEAAGSWATSTWIPGRKSPAGSSATISRRRRRSPTRIARSANINLPRRLPQAPARPPRPLRDLDYFCAAYKMMFAKSVGAPAGGRSEADAEPADHTRAAK